jgi:hypothetical protein
MWTHGKAFAAEHSARSTSMQPLEPALDRTGLPRADSSSDLLDQPGVQDSPTSLAKLLMASRLRRAIVNRTLSMHYQPQFDLISGLASGMEVLARWFPLAGEAIVPSVCWIGRSLSISDPTASAGANGRSVVSNERY